MWKISGWLLYLWLCIWLGAWNWRLSGQRTCGNYLTLFNNLLIMVMVLSFQTSVLGSTSCNCFQLSDKLIHSIVVIVSICPVCDSFFVFHFSSGHWHSFECAWNCCQEKSAPNRPDWWFHLLGFGYTFYIFVQIAAATLVAYFTILE